MRFSLSLVLALVVAARLHGANLFSDDFNRPDETPPDGWLVFGGSGQVLANELLVESTVGVEEAWAWIDTTDFSGNISLQFDIAFDAADATPEVGRHGGVMLMASEKTARYSATMTGYIMDWIDRIAAPNDYGYRFHKWTNGAETPLVPDGSAPDPEIGATWRITASGDTLTFEADGVVKALAEDAEYRSGSIGFWGWSNGQHIHIDNVIVTEPPSAKITANPTSGPEPLDVNFDASGSTTPEGTITAYAWDFGDGATATGPQVSHHYASLGSFKARLAVTDSRGLTGRAAQVIDVTFRAGDVAPWQSADVGTVVVAGGARFDSPECLSVLASGKEIGQLEDHFHFLYQEKAGNAVITAQVRDKNIFPTGARGGLMLRDSTNPDSAFAMMAVNPTTTGTRAIFVSRKSAGIRAAVRLIPAVPLTPPNCYLRLERSNSEFIGSTSPDGVAWTEFYRVTLDAPAATMLAGPALTASDTLETGVIANIVFCGVNFGDTEAPPNPPGNLQAVGGDAKVDLTWDAPVGGGPFTGYRILQNGSQLADVPAAQRNFTDSGLTNESRYCYKVLATRADASSGESNEACAIPGDATPSFHRGDADSNGQLQLTDAVRILNVLFLGVGVISCSDAADADDNGQVQLTDAVRILNVLFLGVGVIPLPGPPSEPCGPDPTADTLECASYDRCG
jgi:chitodextrinase